jgi:hypothetical protein
MANKTKSVDTPQDGVVSINFGNVEALKLKLADESNKTLTAVKDVLNRIDATLIRLEGKYDANQNNQVDGGN